MQHVAATRWTQIAMAESTLFSAGKKETGAKEDEILDQASPIPLAQTKNRTDSNRNRIARVGATLRGRQT